MISTHIRKMAAWHWIVFYMGIILAWAALYGLAIPQEARSLTRIYGADFWQSLCVITPDAAGLGRITVMWALMSGAMMAPTALPAFATYEELGSHTPIRFWQLIIGYLIVWIGFSLLAAALQMLLFVYGQIDQLGQLSSVQLSAVLLIAAGGYQFSALKEGCLAKCRAPLVFFMQYFDEGPLRNGVRLGLVCLGCCWALMLLAFVGGTMNFAFMGLATVLMFVEKIPDLGRFVTKPLGLILVSLGIILILNAMI